MLILLLDIPNYFIFSLSVSFCAAFDRVTWLQIWFIGIAELLLVIRVCALYGNRKFLAFLLGGLLGVALVAAIVTEVFNIESETVFLYSELLPGCWGVNSSRFYLYQWYILLAFEGVLMLLTAYKMWSYRNAMNQTISVLARDSILYFLVIAACLISVLIFDFVSHTVITLQVPAHCTASIAVRRMSMNLRGLIIEDPGNTVHLRPLEFNPQPPSNAEGEDE